MFRLVYFSITKFKCSFSKPIAKTKYKYVFEDENGNYSVKVIYDGDKIIYPINVIVVRPFVEKFFEMGFTPVTKNNNIYSRTSYKLTYSQRG